MTGKKDHTMKEKWRKQKEFKWQNWLKEEMDFKVDAQRFFTFLGWYSGKSIHRLSNLTNKYVSKKATIDTKLAIIKDFIFPRQNVALVALVNAV